MRYKETTTTANLPTSNYFPPKRKKKEKEKKMNEARLAVELVEKYALDPRDALEVVMEGDTDKAAQKMAKKAAPDDEDKQKELEGKFKEKMKKKRKK